MAMKAPADTGIELLGKLRICRLDGPRSQLAGSLLYGRPYTVHGEKSSEDVSYYVGGKILVTRPPKITKGQKAPRPKREHTAPREQAPEPH